MKHRVFAAIIAALMVLVCMPLGFAETPEWTVPEGYNAHDYSALVSFLLRESAVDGKTNGMMLNPDFDPNDPATFSHDPDYGDSNTYSFTWGKDENGEYRLVSVDIRNKHALAGNFDLSGCDKLVGVSLFDLPALTGLSLCGCAELETLYCCMCGAESIDASGCVSLWMVNANSDPALADLVFDGCPFGIALVSAETGGYVSASLDNGAKLLTAAADEGFAFIGWYGNGAFVSGDDTIDAGMFTEVSVFTAKFASTQPLAGDMDGSGVLSFSDVAALYSTIFSGDADLVLSVADVNGDGMLSFADVSALYSRVLGVYAEKDYGGRLVQAGRPCVFY